MKRLCLMVLLCFTVVLYGCGIRVNPESDGTNLDPYTNKDEYTLAVFDNKDVTEKVVVKYESLDLTGPMNTGVTAVSDADVDLNNGDSPKSSKTDYSVQESVSDSSNGSTVKLTNKQRAEYNATKKEKEYLYACVMAEAGGQGEVGMILVADVIITRALYNKCSIVSVITARGQFSTWSNGSVSKYMRQGVSSACKDACNKALSGVDYSKGAYFFNSGSSVANGKLLFKWRQHFFCARS